MPEPDPQPNDKPLALEMREVAVPSMGNPDQAIIEDVTWRVRAEDFWFVGGLNRSGKTDLLSLAAGLLRPLRGSFRLFGREILPRYEPGEVSERLRVGLVFDGGQLLHHLTLAENVALPVQYHRNVTLSQALKEVQPLLAIAEVDANSETFPSAISRNWQQRVGLARALALRPEVLLVDNPLSGLDPQETEWWLEQLSRLADGRSELDDVPRTVVVTGDDFRLWNDRARQFAVLKDRRLRILKGRPSDVAQGQPLLRELEPADYINI